MYSNYSVGHKKQSDHLSGKPGNVREFETCQGNVRYNVNSQGIVREESGKNYCQGKLSQNCSLLVEYLRSIWYTTGLPLKLEWAICWYCCTS